MHSKIPKLQDNKYLDEQAKMSLNKNDIDRQPLQQRNLRANPSDENSYITSTSAFLHSIVISLIVVLLVAVQSTTQQGLLCPKACTCDEQNLETICRAPYGMSGFPHTLNPNTKRIIIHDAQTSVFSGIDYLVKLESIDLTNNKLSSIDFSALSKNVNLNSLNTSHNVITELKDSHVIASLTEVGLNLSTLYTSIESGELKISKWVKINVEEFILKNNNLGILKNFTFIRWSRLKRLDLSHNIISSLETHSLYGLSKLENLNLRGNRLKQVPTLALHGTVQTTPSSSIFSLYGSIRTSFIKILDLSENPIHDIGQESFSMLERAQELYIESCSIQNIHPIAFKGLHTLHLLSLDKNDLREVPTGSFSYLGMLRCLKLNENNIGTLQPNSFKHLSNLEELQINNGSFPLLQRGVFEDLYSLQRLELKYNQNLTRVEPDTFENLSKLTYLSLFSNSIQDLPDDLNDKSLQILDLRGNPLYCGCDLKWLTKWLKKFNETASLMQRNNFGSHIVYGSDNQVEETQSLLLDTLLTTELVSLSCAGPPALVSKLVIDLPENKLECLKPSSDLNVNIGFGMLFFISFIMMIVCLVNCCDNKKHFLMMLKGNMVQNHISMMLPYTQNLHKNVDDLKKETQFHSRDYELINYHNAHDDGHNQAQIYTVQGDHIMYYGPHNYGQYN